MGLYSDSFVERYDQLKSFIFFSNAKKRPFPELNQMQFYSRNQLTGALGWLSVVKLRS